MRFLVIKSSALGDVVQTYPVLHYIKSRFPDSQIDWVIEKQASALITAHPLVDNAIEVDTKSWKKRWWHPRALLEIYLFFKRLRQEEYAAVFDLQSNVKSTVITLACRAKDRVGFGWKSAHERFNCMVTKYRSNPPRGQNIRRDYLWVVQHYFKDASITVEEEIRLALSRAEQESFAEWDKKLPENCWMVCPGAFWQNKKMAPETLEEFLRSIQKAYGASFLFLSGSEEEKKEVLLLASRFDSKAYVLDRPQLPLLQHLMRRVTLVIAMDSLPLHLAGTTSTPTFSIFGPTMSFKFRPLGKQHFSYQGSCPYNMTFEKRCPHMRRCKTGACIREINPRELFATFVHWKGCTNNDEQKI